MTAARIHGCPVHQSKFMSPTMPPQPRCLLLDAMGTLLTFEPPAPRLRAALRAAHGRRRRRGGGAARDPRGDRVLPRAPAPRRATPPAWRGCGGRRPRRCGRSCPTRRRGCRRGARRRRCWTRCASTPTPRCPRRCASCAAAGCGSSSSPTGTSRCTSGSPSSGSRRCSTARSRRPSSAPPSRIRPSSPTRSSSPASRAGAGLARRRLARGRRRGARARRACAPVLVARRRASPRRPAWRWSPPLDGLLSLVE